MRKIDAQLDKIEEKLLGFAREQGLFMPGDRVIAACSGGADSVALLLFLVRRGAELGIAVEACHVDHGLRGETAHRDREFVRALCSTLAVPLYVLDAEAEGIVPPPNAGEDWARRLRYGFFEKLTAGGGRVATAHTLTDQAETLLLRMARGTGVHGLTGIPVQRPGVLRPLLCLERRETEAYCQGLGQPFVTDETNLTDRYARNRIRRHAMPALRAVNPAAEKAVGRLAEKMRKVDDYLARRAGALLAQAKAGEDAWRLEVLQQADPLELEWALHGLAGQDRDPEEKYISLLAEAVRRGSGAVQLTDRVVWRAEKGVLRRCVTAEMPLPAPPQPLHTGVFELPGGYVLEVRTENYEKLEKNGLVHKKYLKYGADYDKIQSGTLLRTRQEGDRFRPAGRGVSKSLKKYLNEAGVPPPQRGLLPLIAREGQVLWLWDAGFAEEVAPDETTKRIVMIKQIKKGE